MSVFRELFVEVPQAILEAAAMEAHDRKRREADAVRTHYDHHGAGLRLIALELGWVWCEYSRVSTEPITVLKVQLKCRHFARFLFDEQELVRLDGSARAFVEHVCKVLQRGPQVRTCTCIEYVPPIPCTSGVCK